MKTYILLIKHKVHWLHMASAILVLGVFTSVTLQQYAVQVFYNQAEASALPVPTAHVLGQTANASRPSAVNQNTSQPAAPTPAPVTTVAKPAARPASVPAAVNKVSAATPAPAATPTPTPPVTVSDIASETTCPGQSSTANAAVVLACMAAYARTQHGLGSVTANPSLVAAASAKVQDMLTCGYSHTACGRAFNYWFSLKGFTGRCSAENIAQGQQTNGKVFIDWMNSAGHRANILNPSYKYIGAAVLPSSGGNLWVMELGGC